MRFGVCAPAAKRDHKDCDNIANQKNTTYPLSSDCPDKERQYPHNNERQK